MRLRVKHDSLVPGVVTRHVALAAVDAHVLHVENESTVPLFKLFLQHVKKDRSSVNSVHF